MEGVGGPQAFLEQLELLYGDTHEPFGYPTIFVMNRKGPLQVVPVSAYWNTELREFKKEGLAHYLRTGEIS